MSELYQLPNGWEWKTLSDVFIIERGGSPRPIKEYITEDEDGINWIKIGDTEKGGKYITTTAQKIKLSGLKKSRLVVEGDFIMSNSMSFGRPYIVKTKGAIHDGWLLMRDKLENMDKDFFYYLLSSNYMYQQFTSKASGTTVKNLNIDLVKSTNIPLPPLLEQQRIVSKLDKLFEKIDKAIALHQKNCDVADAFMGSVLNDVFGELEERYGKTPITDVMKISNKTLVPNDNEEYNYVGLENIESNNGKLVEFTPTLGSEIKSSKVVFEKGMVLYGKLRPYLNKVWISNFDGVATTEILPFYPIDENGLDMNYVKHYFLSPSYLNKVMNNCSGARMPRLTTKFIKSDEAYIPLPSLLTQQKVVKYLDEISQKIEKVKQAQKEKMDSLKALKASILDRAFKGEL